MKRILFLMVLAACFPTMAATVYCVNCGTQATQIANYIKLAASYAQQVQQYALQLQQYQAQLKNLQLNPMSAMGSEVTQLITGIGAIMRAGQSIGGSMADIDANISAKFKNPLAGSFSENFRTWTSTSQDTLGAAMRAAGLHRDAYPTDTAALAALYYKAQSSQGNVAALQTLSEINVMQIQQTQKLQDLIATQNLAANTFMANQNAKEQAVQDANDRLWTLEQWPAPKMRPSSEHHF